ncbi:30S ribosomal protein S10, chloroplastic-like isoform X2 [Actinidia eriantha]|uniref:30S ribosomal protein S10, chloroplastic-like isoform X2 n=1 Tax=Actinidia eriantha TaxID=165200 RepID=UPI00258A10B7|nr:30S ribosomal protein S10, chloroplastic-like isoform X2 [Actinidia eriantha]
MAVSSLTATIGPQLPLSSNFSAISAKPKLSVLSLPSNASTLKALKTLRQSTVRVFAASEVLDSEEILDVPEFDTTEMAKQKIRIKLRSYWVKLIEDSCKQIMDAARTTNAKTMGPVPLPTKKRIYCVLKSPHVHKDARFHFEIRTHQRLIDILHPTAQTIDSLMQLDIPAGVDVEVKL